MLTTRGEGQLPDPNEWNSTPTSATREEMLTPIRIAKGGRRTGAVRIATAKKIITWNTKILNAELT